MSSQSPSKSNAVSDSEQRLLFLKSMKNFSQINLGQSDDHQKFIESHFAPPSFIDNPSLPVSKQLNKSFDFHAIRTSVQTIKCNLNVSFDFKLDNTPMGRGKDSFIDTFSGDPFKKVHE